MYLDNNPLNRHPVGGENVPENCQPADMHNHFKKGSIRFARDAFAREEAPFKMQDGAGLGVGGWLSRDSSSRLVTEESLSL
jgi:hypothetical protein